MGLRFELQIFYNSNQEFIYPEGTEGGIYDPKFALNSKVRERLEKFDATFLVLLDVVRILENEQQTKGQSWTPQGSGALNTFRHLSEIVPEKVEAPGLLKYRAGDYLGAVTGFFDLICRWDVI